MRGCLFVLILAGAVLAGAAWFGSPVLASTVIAAGLQNAGYHAASGTISATSNPPPKLLIGRADRVEIVGAGVDFRTFHAASLDLVLTDVDVVARTAGHISGRIDGAELTSPEGPTARADVTVEGSGRAADASIVVPGTSVDQAVKAAFQARFGVAVTSTDLVAPDVLRIGTTSATIEGRLAIDSTGGIVLSTPLGASPILHLDPSFPLRLRAVSVDAGNLRIDAVLDVSALLGG